MSRKSKKNKLAELGTTNPFQPPSEARGVALAERALDMADDVIGEDGVKLDLTHRIDDSWDPLAWAQENPLYAVLVGGGVFLVARKLW